MLGSSCVNVRKRAPSKMFESHSWLPLRDGCGLFCPER